MGNSNWGGSRPRSGRPRKGEEPRETISFSVDPSIKDCAMRLRESGGILNEMVSSIIRQCDQAGVIPIPGAEFKVEKDDKYYHITLPCIKIK